MRTIPKHDRVSCELSSLNLAVILPGWNTVDDEFRAMDLVTILIGCQQSLECWGMWPHILWLPSYSQGQLAKRSQSLAIPSPSSRSSEGQHLHICFGYRVHLSVSSLLFLTWLGHSEGTPSPKVVYAVGSHVSGHCLWDTEPR